ncbi:eukaryotic translation initiation factor 2 subunit beta-like isoform X2 [Chenopodium quinoa]|uniref:eukaryotic translation initiation factor 2 subunit beta-like isoform X2 n=1 Tax=Chenopodium quinoa TaxID=63459 RepID=UPI000B76D912|nr:eukaryotic translation initiation factor 2 subunit beta-like isoform X2 [Chenopodium quinoa]
MTDGTSLKEAIADLHIPEIVPFDPTKKKKKKKKKKKVAIQHNVDRDDLSRLNEGGINFFLGLTKNKGSVGTSKLFNYDSDAAGAMYDFGEDEEEDVVIQQSGYPLEGNEHDYEYKELLQRVYSFLLEHNPQLAEDKRRSVLRPPLIFSEGSTQTVFVNIMDLCKTMHRRPEQLVNFLLIKLGTSGSLDEENRLIIRGRFAPKSLEDLLQRYINEYVLCNICRTPDTILSKENHIFLLQCELCGSERSVAPIGAGYGTRSERRKTGT